LTIYNDYLNTYFFNVWLTWIVMDNNMTLHRCTAEPVRRRPVEADFLQRRAGRGHLYDDCAADRAADGAGRRLSRQPMRSPCKR
jgi:hypothetical protein